MAALPIFKRLAHSKQMTNLLIGIRPIIGREILEAYKITTQNYKL